MSFIKKTFRNIISGAVCRYKIKRLIPFDEKKAHIMLFDSRAGSTLFQEHLDCHPNNSELGEVFNRNKPIVKYCDKPNAQVNYLSHLIAQTKTPHTGCKISFQQLTRHVNTLEFLTFFKKSKFIILERKNEVASAISLLVAQQTGGYHIRKTDTLQTTNTINPEKLKLWIDWRREIKKTALKILDLLKCDCYKTTYEEFTDNIPGTISRVFFFLDLPNIETKSTLKKTSATNMAARIDNYDELKHYFKNFKESIYFD